MTNGAKKFLDDLFTKHNPVYQLKKKVDEFEKEQQQLAYQQHKMEEALYIKLQSINSVPQPFPSPLPPKMPNWNGSDWGIVGPEIGTMKMAGTAPLTAEDIDKAIASLKDANVPLTVMPKPEIWHVCERCGHSFNVDIKTPFWDGIEPPPFLSASGKGYLVALSTHMCQSCRLELRAWFLSGENHEQPQNEPPQQQENQPVFVGIDPGVPDPNGQAGAFHSVVNHDWNPYPGIAGSNWINEVDGSD